MAKNKEINPVPKKRGRPLIEIDREQFEKLCAMQCTQTEIADFFKINVDTVNAWCKRTYDGQLFSEVYNKFASVGKISLRRTQWKQAENSTRMSIWLGKQYLGQSDKMETTITEIDEEQRSAIEGFLNADSGTDENTNNAQE